MKTFRHGGKNGDIILSLPTIKALGGGAIFIPKDGCESPGLYNNLKELLMQQSYIKAVLEYPSGYGYGQCAPGIPITHDLDIARKQPLKGVTHIVKRYLDAFGVELGNWKEPWLTVEGESKIKGEYVIVNYTGRHVKNEQLNISSKVDWKKVIEGIPERKFFVGTLEEHERFYHEIAPIDYMQTFDALDLARVIKGASRVYCNQSLTLALSQALGKEYYCAFKPGKTNCKLFTKNEHEL